MPYPEIVGSNPTRSSLICVHVMTRLWQRNNSNAGSTASGICANCCRGTAVLVGTRREQRKNEMSKNKQKDPPLRSWKCDGCANTVLKEVNGEVYKYCKPMLEGRLRTKWITDTFIDCLDKKMN